MEVHLVVKLNLKPRSESRATRGHEGKETGLAGGDG